jgi:hypothetical protein
MYMRESIFLISGIITGIFSIPTLFKKPSVKVWLPLYLINCLFNLIFDKYLVKTGKLKYPIKLIPKKKLRINFVYDFLVCPYISIWFCQSTYHSNLKEIIKKLFIFAVPQAAYEIFFERKTDNLKFLKGWNWVRSIFLVFIVKMLSRGSLYFIKVYRKET